MVEDKAINLKPAKERGMRTILLHPDETAADGLAYVDEHYKDIHSFFDKQATEPC